MTFWDALVPGFFLVVGVPCLVVPRQMQRFVLGFNERFGYVEGPDGFRRSAKYLWRLRLIGAIAMLSAAIAAFSEHLARLVI